MTAAQINRALRFIDLCAGIGGFSLGLERAGMDCVGQVEINDDCNAILAKHWPSVPRWTDIRTVNPANLPAVELICGGYPCQPFSLSGKRKGTADDRHLWPEVYRLVTALRPSWLLFENVVGHISMGIDQVLTDLENQDYTCQTLSIPACAVDASHRRNRVWILAHTLSPARIKRSATDQIRRRQGKAKQTGLGTGDVAHSDGVHAQRLLQRQLSDPERRTEPDGSPRCGTLDFRPWLPEPAVGRVVDGIPDRLARCQLEALGNAVVPQVVEMIGRAIVLAEIERRTS